MYYLSEHSKNRLQLIHPDLQKVIIYAIKISTVDFTVLEGLRTEEKQKRLFAKGATSTMNSRHLTGHAVDLGAWIEGKVRWDWPLYYKIAQAVKIAAKELAIPITWGGDWQTFPDGPHFQLSWDAYPKE